MCFSVGIREEEEDKIMKRVTSAKILEIDLTTAPEDKVIYETLRKRMWW